ncbi:ATP-dependent DNA ligase [Labedella populi]|uniref:ATP-dependent DNA ligase n=1 Tax=Labedella populi TaxID=2498850 RepID=A0A444QC90_9MICO|nr:ATP-dependent DNA ligase [Labedella populi]RWZ64274.1 ATP-dependent DNA ligase [Labedella populi]
MATLIVGADEFTLDDRLLEHVKFVATQKLRRNESFLLTWSYPADQGSGRRSVWIHEGSMLHFRFTKQRSIALNAEWLHNLLEASHSVRGLNLDDVPEPKTGAAAAPEAQQEGVGRRS